MSVSRRFFLVTSAAAISVLSSMPAIAGGTVVDVSLWDNPDQEMTMGLGYAMGGDQSLANMGVRASTTEVPAGSVTFKVTNDSKDIEHEMVVAPVESGTPLPYNADIERVIEDEVDNLGEVSELEPGQSGEVTLDMTPGEYILYCNVPQHYAAGMWTLLTVK